MDTKKITAAVAFCSVAVVLIILLASCGGRTRREVRFSYGTILRNEFIYNVGKVVPVTIEQTIEFDGIFSEDGQYLFYASDKQQGNFDIYLRALDDITMVRITSHPAKDYSPAISPDGKRLAFVSLREDPEGDIFVVDINPTALLDKAAQSPTDVPSLDGKSKNLTQYQDPVTKDIRIIRDASPSWSPDSQWIAFSSNRDGIDNVWMIQRNGKNLTQITKKGGLFPRFSPDGKKLIYISYEDEKGKGDIYIKDLITGKEQRITATPHIELHPCFMSNNDEIVYTFIDRDTNGDGKINLKDASLIMYKNLKSGLEYPLTLRSQNSFMPRFSQALKKLNERFFNVIIFSDQIGENININIIPEEGVIPKKSNAQTQYELAQTYLTEYDDKERYLLCLERAYHFFGDKKDNASVIFVGKSLVEAAKAFRDVKNLSEAERIEKLLSSISKDVYDYRSVMARYLNAVSKGISGEKVLLDAIAVTAREAKYSEYLPYLLEELGDEQKRLGKRDAALETYKKVLLENPKYGRTEIINFKIADLQYQIVLPELPEAYERAINSEREYIKIAAAKQIIKIFSAEPNISKRIRVAEGILSKVAKKESDNIIPLMQYILGEAYVANSDYAKAKTYLQNAVSKVSKTNYLFYKANKLLGDIAHRQSDFESMEKYYYQNLKNYLFRWKQSDFRDILTRLVDYYEDQGARYLAEKKEARAAEIYEKYIEVVTTAHLLREFDDIYQAYGSRAHVLYIDSFARTSEKEKLLSLEAKYTDKLSIARLNYDKAYLYGLGYIYTKLGLLYDEGTGESLEKSLESFKKSLDQLAWALFMDDTYVEPYILRGWISQYIDLRRKELGESKQSVFDKFFPRFLWEANVPLYERALAANDETKNPEGEGNIHLNLANTYFLLNNYPQALRHFEKAKEYKREFASPIQEALFHFHMGVCYWQNDKIEEAREQMRRTLLIYNSLAQKYGYDRFKEQVYTLYRYFALFDRVERNFHHAIHWYNELLAHAEKNKISIDRSRIYQEIAHCYRELGNRQKSLEYLDRADELIAHETDKEKTYKLRFKVLGIGPISFIDLGPDTVVIGDNRLYEELTAEYKNILSLSMREELHYDAGDYASAINYLKKKLACWEKKNHRLNKIGKVRTLNNIGFCYYKMGYFDKALEYFKSGWDYASRDDVNDLEGVFNTILNYSNLCTILFERGKDVLGNSFDVVIREISRYRDNYENQKFETDLATKQKEMKLKKQELTREDVDAIRRNAKTAADEIYHQLEVALGSLKFAKAELLIEEHEVEGIDPHRYYRQNQKIYDLYAEALQHFQKSLEYADKHKNSKVKCKLLMNIASCHQKLGAYEDAYDALGRAETIANTFAYSDLIWVVYYKLAEFLHRYGVHVEKAAMQMAREYYNKAIDELIACPQCNASQVHYAQMLFDSFTRFLLEEGQWKEAFEVMEKGYAVKRAMSISGAGWDFYDRSHKEKFDAHRMLIRELSDARANFSALLEAGESRDSEKARRAQKIISEKINRLREHENMLKKDSSLFSSFLAVGNPQVFSPTNAVVVGFFSLKEKIGAWRLDSNLSYTELKAKNAHEGEKSVRDYLMSLCGNQTKRCFVVLNSTALSVLSPSSLQQFPAFTFVPSFERARYFAMNDKPFTNAVVAGGKKLISVLRGDKELSGIHIDEYRDISTDLATYSIIVAGEDEFSIEPSILFKRKHSPGLYIARFMPQSFERMILCTEAALYAGCKGIIFHNLSNEGKIAKLIATLRTKSLSDAMRNFTDGNIVPIGRGIIE
ncbi:MAG: hypothetical protein N2316_04375 [Spirochaetes bacterium]|nr:hypothetical protein [Spirochaetota bacterium]